MKYKITGTVVKIFNAEVYEAYRTQKVWVEIPQQNPNSIYKNIVELKALQAGVQMLDQLQKGDNVTMIYILNGKRVKDEITTSLILIGIKSVN